MSFTNKYEASLIVASSKSALPNVLNAEICKRCVDAIASRKAFSLVLSGGSLPEFLSSLAGTFKSLGLDPKFHLWHILLADERCVPEEHEDSNMGAIRKNFLSQVAIPKEQIYGINTDLLNEKDSTKAIAADYETTFRKILDTHSDGRLDLAVLGFGPDGHTCSLFPNHPLLQVGDEQWVASIDDSPKPPPKRITLTLPVLNDHTRHVIVCGAGESKGSIVSKAFTVDRTKTVPKETKDIYERHTVSMAEPAPFPVAMVRPQGEGVSLTWMIDLEAAEAAGL
ncbi:hypothetical protein MPSEU_000284000 [Mayamaea pseudoterrestris]|nr:hypothetical protein MPSEU_000284000 [Mayamaea pseudoterrestris]